MKFGKNIKNLFVNKNLLLLLTILVVFILIVYIHLGLHNLVIIYILIASLIYYYSDKNMMYVFGIPLIIVIIINLINRNIYQYEGMENETKSTSNVPKKKPESIPLSSNDNINVDMMNETTSDPEPHSEESFEGNIKKGKYRLDYATTMEDAYKELNDVLGSDGIKNLTKDTHNLMKKQLQLAEAMKSMSPLIQGMAPLLKQAQGLLSISPSLAVTPPIK